MAETTRPALLTTTPQEVLDRRRRRERSRSLRNRHGISLEDYERLLAAQGGACAICQKQPVGGDVLRVDHCHTRGLIRGLLCNRCNVGLGYLGDDSDVALRAAIYLAQPLAGALPHDPQAACYRTDDAPPIGTATR